MVRSGALNWAILARIAGLSTAAAVAPPTSPVAPAATTFTVVGMREAGRCATTQAATKSSVCPRT